MSIINEALKKTQAHLKEKTAVIADERFSWRPPITEQPIIPPRPSEGFAQQPSPPMAKQITKKWHIIILAEIVLFLVAASVIFVLQPRVFHAFLQPPAIGPTLQKSHAVSAQRPQVNTSASPDGLATSSANLAVNPSPTSWGSKPTDLVLSGIMMNQNKMVALINNEIYELGDEIDGKKITKITLNQVELRDDKGLTILDVRQKKGSR